MAIYYVGSVLVAVLAIAAVTAMVIHALNKKGDVTAGFWLSRLGFTLTAKDRPEKLNP